MADTDRSRLAIEWLDLGAPKRNARNPRKHSKAQINRLTKSIRTFGFNVPVLVDADGNVLAGHGRLLAAEKLGCREIPAIRIDHLTPAQAKAFTIADNRLADLSSWNDQLLAEVFNELAQVELNFDIDATGFDVGEIDVRIEGLESDNDDSWPDRLPTSCNAATISKLGDQWLLGKHVIRCDNALESSAYEALLQGTQAAMAFTDPPYNVPIDGHATGLGKIHHREFAMASGEMTSSEFESFLKTTCALLVQHTAPASLHFICMDWRHAAELLAAGRDHYSQLKNICVWVKNNGGMGSLYRSRHEFVFVFKNGNGKHRNNVELGRHGRNRTNVWHYPSANDFGRPRDDGNPAGSHPTPKPVKMIAEPTRQVRFVPTPDIAFIFQRTVNRSCASEVKLSDLATPLRWIRSFYCRKICMFSKSKVTA